MSTKCPKCGGINGMEGSQVLHCDCPAVPQPLKKLLPDERRRNAAARDPRQIALPLDESYKAGLIFPMKHREDGLTKQEEKVLRMTARLWNAYGRLKEVHPSEKEELQLYIHQIQYLVARRVAKRLDPHVWA